MMLPRAVLVSSSQEAGRKPKRLRTLLVSALLAASVALIGPSSTAGLTGSGAVDGPWSCGPDQQVALSFYVTGSGPASVGLDIHYHKWTGTDAIWGTYIYPGYTYISPPYVGRQIHWFLYSTHGNANLVSWVKSCS